MSNKKISLKIEVFAQNYSGSGDSEAFIGQVTWAIADKWDVTIGARTTEEDKV